MEILHKGDSEKNKRIRLKNGGFGKKLRIQVKKKN